MENFINYKDPNSRRFLDSDDDEADIDISERNVGGDFSQFKMMMGGGQQLGKPKPGQQLNEEFKMMEGEEDQVDLLDEKQNSQDLGEFYEKNDQFVDLKNQLRMNIPGMKMMGMPGMMSGPQTNNNTEAGDTESSEE